MTRWRKLSPPYPTRPPWNDVSRRQFLESTGATLGLLVLTGGCGSDGTDVGTAADGAGSSSDSDGISPGGAGAGGSAPRNPGGGPSGAGGSGGQPGTSPGAGGSGTGGDGTAGGEPGGTAATGGTAGGAGEPGGAGGSGGAAGMAEPGDPPPSASGTMSVGVAGGSVDDAVRRAVELAGGIDEIQPGQTVFIKPNAVSDRGPSLTGIRTSNEVLAAVVRLVKERDPGRIIVGDRSARGFDSATVFDTTGMADAALEAGADEIFAAPIGTVENDEWVRVRPDGHTETWPDGILAMRRLLDADHVVNVPACKNHMFAGFTMSMKNFIGGIGDASRDPLHYQFLGDEVAALSRDIVLLNRAFAPLINIIDATTALINGGPQGTGANTVRTTPGLIIAGKDRVAADAMGVSLLKLELSRTDVPQADRVHTLLTGTPVWQIPQLASALELGLGVSGAADVELRFDAVDDAGMLEELFRG